MRELEAFNHGCLLQLTGRAKKDKISVQNLLIEADMLGLEHMIQLRRLKFLGQIERMDATRLPKILLYGSLAAKSGCGLRSTSTQVNTYQDLIHRDLQEINLLSAHQAEIESRSRSNWRALAQDSSLWNQYVESRVYENHKVWLESVSSRGSNAALVQPVAPTMDFVEFYTGVQEFVINNINLHGNAEQVVLSN